MQFKRIAAAVIILGIFFWSSNASAGDIEAGTFSVRASSNAAFHLMDYDNGHSNSFSLNTSVGYFFLKNWEIGAQLAVCFGEYSHSSYQTYSLLPFLGYHWTLNDKSNFYGLIGAGYGLGYSESDSGDDMDSEVITMFAEVGYEYFLTRNISLGLGIRGEQSENEADYDSSYGWSGEDDDTLKALSTRLSLKLYF